MTSSRSGRGRTWWTLGTAVVVVLGASLLTLGRGSGSPATVEERAEEIASGLRCPVCQNLSVADSDSRLALEMREDILRRLREGQGPNEIRRYFVGRYGEWILLSPSIDGLGLFLWVAPAALALGGLLLLAGLRSRFMRANLSDRGRGAEDVNETLSELP